MKTLSPKPAHIEIPQILKSHAIPSELDIRAAVARRGRNRLQLTPCVCHLPRGSARPLQARPA
jgi:hypothetical protein